MIKVFNLSTQEYKHFFDGMTPSQAVVAAYAQERKDFNTWQYQKRYGALVTETDRCITCGDWTMLKGNQDAKAG